MVVAKTILHDFSMNVHCCGRHHLEAHLGCKEVMVVSTVKALAVGATMITSIVVPGC